MELDFLSTPLPERQRELLFRFGELAPGAHLIVLASDAATESLETMQKEHPGQFEWWPLENGPTRWRILVVRRDRYSRPQRQVLEFMDRDHERFLGLMREALQALEARRFDEARRLCRHLATGLAKHARMEEDVLLPLVAEKLGSPRGPAMVLRDQHLTIEAELDLLEADCALSEEKPDTPIDHMKERLGTLLKVLTEHVAAEERILYPVVDHLLSPAERDAVVRRCQSMA